MALEPITRQEKIIAGQDLTPITRMEKFLKQYGGGSGGVTSWNDLTDKPFGEVTTEKEVLAECQPEFVANQGLFALTDDLTLSDGETYIVVWNGVEYKSVVHVQMIDGVALLALGELSFMDGPAGNGEPFGIIYAPSVYVEFGWTGIIAPLDGSTTLTISIRQEVPEVKKISGKYVEGMGWAEKSVSGKVVVEETAYRVNNSDFGTLVNPEPLENGSYASMPTEFSFESGKTYRITVDGVPYIGTAEYREGYGNFGGGDGVPLVDENGGYHGVFVTAMGAGYSNYFYYDEGPEEGHTGTFIIEEVAEVETVHPIDEKFIVLTSPNGTKYNLSVADDGTLSAVAAT